MNKYYIISIICFIAGIALLSLGISRGEGEVYWAFIIPIFKGTGVIFFMGTILIILGMFLLVIGFASGSGSIVWGGFDELDYEDDYSKPHPKKSTGPKTKGQAGQPPAQRPARRTSIRHGGVAFIGPIPIIWGSDKKIGFIMAIVALIIVVIFVIFALSWIL